MDTANSNADDRAPRTKEQPIEAYGVKGLKNSQWRKTFKSVTQLNSWLEKHDAVAYGTREAE